jgi:hypothetical protein
MRIRSHLLLLAAGAMPPVRDMQSVVDAVATMRPVIGPVSAAGASGPGVPVRVSVIRDGKVT